MCTLVLAFQQVPGVPVVVAANRDELLGRPSTPLHRWAGEPFLAPRDEQKGGTWLGLTRARMFVGVTNRFGAVVDATRQSRGQLVVEALRQPSAAALHQALASLDPRRFNPFHLLYADPSAAFVTWSDGAERHQKALPPGVHVVTERSLGGDDRSRTERIQAHWVTEVGPALATSASQLLAPAMTALEGLLKLHGEDPLGGTCVHTELGYGTRSSLVLEVPERSERPRFPRLRWAEGHPCLHPFADQGELARELFS